MSLDKILFVDRDGCLIEEPADFQVDHLDKFRLLPGVIEALARLVRAGYQLVMVTNQDGLGTDSFPEATFWPVQNMLLNVFSSQGIEFREICVDRHFAHEPNETRKPKLGLVLHYLRDGFDRAASAMVGDRLTDLQFAENLGVRGLRVGPDGISWMDVARALLDAPRRGSCVRTTRETQISVSVDLDAQTETTVHTGIGFFDHMLEALAKHGGFTLRLNCVGDLHIDEHHTIEDCALALGAAIKSALGDKRGIGRYAFTVPMDETRASAVLDLSGRPYFVFEGKLERATVGAFPTELLPHFFRSLCESLGANLHLSVQGENDHHQIEACFKVVARCLRLAIARVGDVMPSTKGSL
jgi:imidazoleglycerol-phosphate dehydratase / histidinol-phosphatase